MTTPLICPKGHRWEAQADAPAACPMCGAAAAPPPDARAAAPTVTYSPPPELPGPVTVDLPRSPADSPAPSSDRVSVPGCEILRELGRGGMGVVYWARHRRLDRVVALKMLLAGVHAGEEDLARFRTDAEAIARLQHPNVVQVFDVGEADGLPFFALEYCPGGSLQRQLSGTPLPPPEAAARHRQ